MLISWANLRAVNSDNIISSHLRSRRLWNEVFYGTRFLPRNCNLMTLFSPVLPFCSYSYCCSVWSVSHYPKPFWIMWHLRSSPRDVFSRQLCSFLVQTWYFLLTFLLLYQRKRVTVYWMTKVYVYGRNFHSILMTFCAVIRDSQTEN